MAGLAEIDTAKWSGEGDFTARLVEHLRALPTVGLVRVEDAPASRTEADYNFISNEVFVVFTTRTRRERGRRFGIFPVSRTTIEPEMTLEGLERVLAAVPGVGEPDYFDQGMLQYLRAERVIPPYQSRGYKLVELVRIYESGGSHRP
ncbi:MAG: hypothetical protein ABUS56_05285 [Acidobacteriota bacterium]